MALAFTGAAGAEGFGELTRFGESANGSQQEGKLAGERAVRLGVDTSDNSVYVLDEPEESEETINKKEEPTGPFRRHLRLQKFSPNVGAYSFSASSRFTELSPFAAREEGARDIQGVAVDPVLKRVYVLAVDLRQSEVKEKLVLHNDLGAPVASTLFAFSTTPACNKEGKECKLSPAQGTKTIKLEGQTENAVLLGRTEFEAQSDTPGKALLAPSGITVDPETHEVIILGHEDPTGGEVDELERDHYVLQRIQVSPTTGEAKLGARFVDQHDFLRLPERVAPPDSPIVVQESPGSEHILVNLTEGIAEIPYSFSGEPSLFSISAVANGGVLHGPEPSTFGSQMSAAPAGGPIYMKSVLKNEAAKAERSGVLQLAALNGSEIGWTGAQVPSEGSEGKCVVEPSFLSAVSVAAGAEGKVFVLSPAFLGAANRPAVIEFGPGGSGCPLAGGATTPIAEVNHQRTEEAAVGEKVTFKTERVSQADALKVEWDFGDGSKETIGVNGSNCSETLEEPDPQCPHAQHAFTRAGSFQVTVKTYTDDLAGPSTITTTGHILVTGTAVPRAQAIGPESVVTNQPAEFDGSPSSDPAGPNQITEYHWTFGDGQTESKTSPTISHLYTRPGAYTVSLTVTDAHGATSQPYTLPIPVEVTEPSGAELHGVQGAVGGAGQAGAGVADSKTTGGGGPVPIVVLTRTSLSASSTGLLPLTLSCPLAESTCAGTVILRAIGALGGRRAAGNKPRGLGLMLAHGSFTLRGGAHKTIVLHLSASARSQLASAHLLRAQVTILAHDGAGATHTTQTTVTVRSAAGRSAHRRR